MMAWRSSGSTNDEMINKLRRFGVISTSTLEQGFRNVDRRFFVPRGQEDMAHADQPLKEGNIHLSAPHIYGSALEALELQPHSSLSFLNCGSGTGYVSCIVADIMGPRSSNYGIEIHSDVVEHSKNAIETWKLSSGRDSPQIHILHGNALDVDATSGEAVVGFDRIYVGAAVERRHLTKLTKLLRPGGILVGPVDDELVKVVKIGSSRDGNDSEDFTQQVLSGVRFASLLHYPKLETIIPSTIWSPSVHNYYPDSFRASCKEILLCSNSGYVQPRQAVSERQINLAAMLPRVLWLEIMSYTHRSWFEPAKSETAFLRQRLLEEQADAQRAHQARLEAEARLHAAERERDVYRLLANRWQSRLQALLRGRGRNAASAASEEDDAVVATRSDMETALDTILNENGRRAIVVSAALRRFHADSDEDEDHDSEMDEDDHDMHEAVAAGDDDASLDDASARRSRRAYSVTMEDVDADESDLVASPTDAFASRPQVRTVSISSEDL
jgi:protein-L-isoaspartate O-methyltransferase